MVFTPGELASAEKPKDIVGVKAIVVHPDIRHSLASGPHVDPEYRLREAVGLAQAIFLEIIHAEVVPIRQPKPATLFGAGAVEHVRLLVAQHAADLVVVDCALTPVQQRNLERAWKTKVIDRTGLILEIFGARARTAEGRLQVQLAALTYRRGRLVRAWTHLERQRGGLGKVGGPGETQIELDRRMITDKIAKLTRELEEVRRTRDLHRQARRRVPYPLVALVGYTNAGKSTLFNRLTQSDVLAADMLFATLDPTMREIRLPSGRHIILSDTVGFISDLPTQLVAAFRATLEEVLEADLIVHVRDCAHTETQSQKHDVLEVLNELGLKSILQDGLIEALNKIDLLPPDRDIQALKGPNAIPLSALTGQGLPDLLQLMDQRLAVRDVEHVFTLALSDGAPLAWLYAHGHVMMRRDDEKNAYLKVRLSPENLSKFHKHFRQG
ncbi:MAG: GTPase HflX [Holosporales bacterium]